MQKKLLALAVAGAFAVPMAAAADVTVYGQMHFSLDYFDNDSGNLFQDESDFVTGMSRQSRIGFKGGEDLGGGNKAVWQIETVYNTAANNAGGSLSMRNTFVGLAGDWGTALVGRHDTPYKLSTGKIDLFTDRAADYNVLMGNAAGSNRFDQRAPQTIAYITPNFSGFTGAIAYVSHYFNGNPTSNNQGTISPTNTNDEAISLMGTYDNGPLFLAAAYEQHAGRNFTGVANTVGGANAWKIGGAYKFGNSTVGAIWETMEGEQANSVLSRDAWYLNFSHAFGANVVKVAYGQADDSDAPGSDGADHWAIGLDHNLSKRTALYGLYAQTDNDAGGRYGLHSQQHVGDSYAGSGVAAGSTPKVFSVGVIHKF
jgi:predicted porin